MKALFAEFENNDRLGIIMPETFPVLELQAEWGGNLDGVKALLERLDCTQEQLSEDPGISCWKYVLGTFRGCFAYVYPWDKTI